MRDNSVSFARRFAASAFRMIAVRSTPFHSSSFRSSSREPRLARLLLLSLLTSGLWGHAHAQCPPLGPQTGPYFVTWQLVDSLSACPAGDSVFAGKPARLRATVGVFDAVTCLPIAGMAPENIWVTYSILSQNLKVNDNRAQIFADDSTNALGQTRITIPSFSGCGTIRLTLRVGGINYGNKTATVRTTDTDASGRDSTGDDQNPCDIDYVGGVTQADRDIVKNHVFHWRRTRCTARWCAAPTTARPALVETPIRKEQA